MFIVWFSSKFSHAISIGAVKEVHESKSLEGQDRANHVGTGEQKTLTTSYWWPTAVRGVNERFKE